MIRFACPSCASTFSVADDKAGKTSNCPKCKAQFVIPGEAPPPLPTSPVKASTPVAIEPCPKCQTQLSVEPSDLGSSVECPECGKEFTARKVGTGSKAALPAPPPAARREEPPPRRRREEEDDDEDDRPRSRRRRGEDDEDDDEDRPRSRRRQDDDEEDDRPRRRRRSGRSRQPHRGGLILALGILSMVVCGIFTGIPAVIMGGSDLKSMDAGRMDSEGRTLTQVGRILGIVNLALTAVAFIFYCVIFAMAAKR